MVRCNRHWRLFLPQQKPLNSCETFSWLPHSRVTRQRAPSEGRGVMSRRITAALAAAAVTLILASGGASGRSTAPGQQLPKNQTLPLVSGTALVPNTLTAGTGSWQGKGLKFAYQWLRCDSAGASCSAISGATGSTDTLSTADAARTLRVIVTASNQNGSTAATSAQTAVVAQASSPPPPSPGPSSGTSPVAPSDSSLPVVSGTAQQNQTLSTSTGSWTGTTPLTYAYQWQRCGSGGGSCVPISGATGASYGLGLADVGSTIRASVTASNSAGSATAASTATPPVASDSPTPSGSCNGCYLEDKLDGSVGGGWLTEISNAFGGAGTGSISFIPGLFGQAAREFVPASPALDYSKRQLVGIYKGNGDPAIHTNVGETTWYRVFFRDDSNTVPANSDGYWFEVWHESVSGAGNSMAFGIYADNPNGNGVGANPRFLIRPGGGVEGSPIYHHYYAAPGSFQLHHWYDIVAKVTWGSTASTGALSIWIDGQPFSAVASNGPSGENFTNGQGVPTMYQKLDGTYDHPSFDPALNYAHQVPWDLIHDFDEVLVGPTAASVGLAP